MLNLLDFVTISIITIVISCAIFYWRKNNLVFISNLHFIMTVISYTLLILILSTTAWITLFQKHISLRDSIFILLAFNITYPITALLLTKLIKVEIK